MFSRAFHFISCFVLVTFFLPFPQVTFFCVRDFLLAKNNILLPNFPPSPLLANRLMGLLWIDASNDSSPYFHTDLITKEGANEVKIARGSPKPTKYGQLDSTYIRRLGAVHPINAKDRTFFINGCHNKIPFVSIKISVTDLDFKLTIQKDFYSQTSLARLI